MKVAHFSEINLEKITDPSVKGVTKRVLISPDDGAPNFVMRLFHVEPGGFTFNHAHDFEHEVFIVEGKGELVTPEKTIPFEAGHTIYVAPNEQHQFKNTGDSQMSFICVVPKGIEK